MMNNHKLANSSDLIYPWVPTSVCDWYIKIRDPGSSCKCKWKHVIMFRGRNFLDTSHLHQNEGGIVKVGEFPEFTPEWHPMRGLNIIIKTHDSIFNQTWGSIYFNPSNKTQIILRGFYYPKPGPNAFFWAGEMEPSCNSDSVSFSIFLLESLLGGGCVIKVYVVRM